MGKDVEGRGLSQSYHHSVSLKGSRRTSARIIGFRTESKSGTSRCAKQKSLKLGRGVRKPAFID